MSSLDAIERVAQPVEQEQPAQFVRLQVIEQETRAARGNQHISGIRSQEPQRDEKGVIAELRVALLLPKYDRHHEHHGQEPGVDDLQQFVYSRSEEHTS